MLRGSSNSLELTFQNPEPHLEACTIFNSEYKGAVLEQVQCKQYKQRTRKLSQRREIGRFIYCRETQSRANTQQKLPPPPKLPQVFTPLHPSMTPWDTETLGFRSQ
jgi:hypothetical protein